MVGKVYFRGIGAGAGEATDRVEFRKMFGGEVQFSNRPIGDSTSSSSSFLMSISRLGSSESESATSEPWGDRISF